MPKKVPGVAFVALLVMAFLLPCAATWAAPATINYQAKLLDSDGLTVTDATTVTFTLWDSPSGGNQLIFFSDEDVVTPDAEGVVNTQIGDDPDNPVPAWSFTAEQVWLNVNLDGFDINPRVQLAPAAYALSAFSSYGSAYVITTVTHSASENGANLVKAYADASALTPNGQPLSATNRAAVFLLPGRYHLGNSQLVLDTEFVDLIGLSMVRSSQLIQGDTNGLNSGVVRQTANDVHLENLTIESTRAAGFISNIASNEPAAYFPDSQLTGTLARNCEFKANESHAFTMRVAIGYGGSFYDCVAGAYGFGGAGNTFGTFVRCSAGERAFGGENSSGGTFFDCVGGHYAFGGSGTSSGDYTRCTGGDSSFGGIGASVGNYYDCVGGNVAFGGYGLSNGTYHRCKAGYQSFGGNFGNNPTPISHALGTYMDCEGGDYSFGGSPTTGNSIVSGTFIRCTGRIGSFGYNADCSNAKFFYCHSGSPAFGASGTPSPNAKFCAIVNTPYP